MLKKIHKKLSDINTVAIENESALLLSLFASSNSFKWLQTNTISREKIYDYHLYRTKKGLGNALGLCKWLEYS